MIKREMHQEHHSQFSRDSLRNISRNSRISLRNQKAIAGRAYIATVEQVTKGELVQGTISIAGHAAFTLFDYGASHSFIFIRFAKTLPLTIESLNYPLKVRTPTGDQSFCNFYILSIEVLVAR
jgi:hypothetical protein